ncbi:MAG: hypothetical protein D6737_04535 [Chloroflexi bacterium]|nr:MAG: hypothetical protein CUN54_07720 [Phototrophicales bacterium]RMF81598.1 MAG: hypothetical protein D6737_04535 [Chloroflexota bacterium]
MYDERYCIKKALQFRESEAERRRQKNRLIKLAKEHQKKRKSLNSTASSRQKWLILPLLISKLQRWIQSSQHQQAILATDNCIEEPNPC